MVDRRGLLCTAAALWVGDLLRIYNQQALRQCHLQGPLLVLAMGLMHGGSLRAALHSPVLRERLRWQAG